MYIYINVIHIVLSILDSEEHEKLIVFLSYELKASSEQFKIEKI